MNFEFLLETDPTGEPDWADMTALIPMFGGIQAGGVANHCEIGAQSGIDLDDDAAAETIPARRRWRATVEGELIGSGRVCDKTLSRGQMPIGDSRKFDVELNDANDHLKGIVVDKWKRPAETDVARVQALHAEFLDGSPRQSTELGAGYISEASPVNLPAKTYDMTDPAGVITHLLDVTGKQAFVTIDEDLYYAPDTDTSYASDIVITDVEADVDNIDKWAPDAAARGALDGNELFTGVTIGYGTSSRSTLVADGSEANHDHYRASIFDSDAIAADVGGRAEAFLNNNASEEPRYSVQLSLPTSAIPRIAYGMMISFRSAACGVLTPVTLRIGNLVWEIAGPEEMICKLELGRPEKMARRVKKGTPPVVGPVIDVPQPGGGGVLCYSVTEDDFGTQDPLATSVFGTWGIDELESDGANGSSIIADAGVGQWITGTPLGEGIDTATLEFDDDVIAPLEIHAFVTLPAQTLGDDPEDIFLSRATFYIDGGIVGDVTHSSETTPTVGDPYTGQVAILSPEELGIVGETGTLDEINVNFGYRVTEEGRAEARVVTPIFDTGWVDIGAGGNVGSLSLAAISGASNVNPTLVALTGITVAQTPTSGPNACVVYPQGQLGHFYGPVFIAEADGSTDTFSTPLPYIPGTLGVFVDPGEGTPVLRFPVQLDPTRGKFRFPDLGTVPEGARIYAQFVIADSSIPDEEEET